MAKYSVESATLKATADAIREKTGSSGLIEWKDETGFADAIDEISVGSGDGSGSGSNDDNVNLCIEFDAWYDSPTYRIDACMIDGDGNTIPVVYEGTSSMPDITAKNNSFFVIEGTVWRSPNTPNNKYQVPISGVSISDEDGKVVWISNGKALIFLSCQSGAMPWIAVG